MLFGPSVATLTTAYHLDPFLRPPARPLVYCRREWKDTGYQCVIHVPCTGLGCHRSLIISEIARPVNYFYPCSCIGYHVLCTIHKLLPIVSHGPHATCLLPHHLYHLPHASYHTTLCYLFTTSRLNQSYNFPLPHTIFRAPPTPSIPYRMSPILCHRAPRPATA